MEPRTGDLVLAREAPVGAVGIVPDDARICLGQRTVLLRPDPSRVEPRYLLYLLLSPQLQHAMTSRSEGSTVAHLNMSDIRALQVPLLHDPGEQRSISESLGALDAHAELNLRMADNLAALARLLYAEVIEGATEMRLDDVATQIRTSVQPLRAPTDEFDHYSIPAFDNGRLPERVLGSTIKSGKTLLDGRAVLVSKLNPGRQWRVWAAAPQADTRAVCSTEFLAVQPRKPFPFSYLHAAVRFDQTFRTFVLAHVAGTTGSHQRIRPGDLLSAPVPRPEEEALGRWIDSGQPLLELEDHARKQNVVLEKLRDLTLREVFAGRLSLPLPINTDGALVA
ncbi:MAG: type restriction enzyme subunit [Thermoleophilaceae bacterium]|nr:type restriction enzyme subunit [Thermoleophilaceae bacterium]